MQIQQFKQYAPEISICVGHLDGTRTSIIEDAVKFGSEKIQLFKPHFTKETIDKAHNCGIKCNVFWSDDPQEAQELLDMGADTILTNDYALISQHIKR